MTWRGWQVVDGEKPRSTRAVLREFDEPPGTGDVVVDVGYSSINYKDGLALMGRPGVIRRTPLVAGIDLVGTVVNSDTAEWPAGTRVLVNGWGIGEEYDGGLVERVRVREEWLVRVPDVFTSAQAAAIGTAGFTAMLGVLAIEERAATAGPEGRVLVTGASGGVGSIAVAILARCGYAVTASTGRRAEHDYLRRLGATEVIDRHELSDEVGRPLQSTRWIAAIDAVGGPTLANVLAQTEYGGVVAACGLADTADLPATVMPFILRGITLAGINSVYCPSADRLVAWERLAADLDPGLLDGLTETVPLAEAQTVAARILDGGVRGRTVVDVTH
jgi:acrylyl-CoA reductase (NADPH)